MPNKPIHGAPVPTWKKLGLLESAPIECAFNLGQKVTYTNDAGLKFPMQIIGFSDPADNMRGAFIHLCREGRSPDGSAWWFAHSPNELEAKKETA